MKVILFTMLLAVAASYPIVKTWTLNELSEVIDKSEGSPEMRKYYIEALNAIMYALFTGTNEASIHANIISPSGHKKWTMPELKTALQDPALNKALKPYYERSYHYLTNDKPEGSDGEVEVVIPALDISTWSIVDLLDALEDPDTKPALKPYLEAAKKEIKHDFSAGIYKENVTMVTPVGLITAESGAKPTVVAKTLTDISNLFPELKK